ncbi:MAG: SUMF1/EgtB/PvdO family nonheme iron enzyme [Kouleothrix sp.]|jgi:formylglycine-generating enzyme required for sulfatase activity|nr:SUMF1/EgtB/PvdO family nonheme iron enzyme [Kouleothrix sp.]
MDLLKLLPAFISIPAGSFLMGTPERALSGLARAYGGTRESYREEAPQHLVGLPAFAIARTPVTNALYAAFTASTGTRPPIYWHGPQPPEPLHTHPVADVSWHEALAFCAWLNQQLADHGGAPTAIRLPTEAEWERAARGVDGRMFPWGNGWDAALANTRESGIGATTPAGAYLAGASADGCLDLAGNVWEWTASLDALYPYHPADGREGQHTPGRRILRGGSYANPHGFARCACRFRLQPTLHNQFLGFRLAS